MRRTGFQLVPLCCTGVGPATTSSRLQPIGSSIFYKIKWPVNNKKQKVMREETGLVIVSVVTFFIVLPILCGTWPYSPYYRAASSEEKEEEEDDDDSFFRSYLAGLAGGHEDNNNDSQVTLLVTIVTVRREGQFYLSRVVARLHQLLSKDNGAGDVRVLICNVDHIPELHQEALDLGRIYPVVQRDGQHQQQPSSNTVINKEKEDYVFCLNASRHQMFRADYVLVLEDDAVPHEDLLPVTRRVIDYLSVRRPDFFYVKLYHPERIQNYWQPEPWRIAEWLAVSVLSVFLLTLRFRLRRPFLWIVYVMVLMECLGRPHTVLRLKRWIGPAAYNLLAATECCTLAMLFTDTSAYIASTYLSSITCTRGYAKDTALYHYARQSQGRLQAFVVEPNLVQHIGIVSTLRF